MRPLKLLDDLVKVSLQEVDGVGFEAVEEEVQADRVALASS